MGVVHAVSGPNIDPEFPNTILRGEARVLARTLTRRFGELPAWAEAHLNAATEAQLEAWSDAALDTRSLAEVFAEP